MFEFQNYIRLDGLQVRQIFFKNKIKTFFFRGAMQFQFDSPHKKTHKIQKRQTAKSVMAIKTSENNGNNM